MTDHGTPTSELVQPSESPHLTHSSQTAPPTSVTRSPAVSEGPAIAISNDPTSLANDEVDHTPIVNPDFPNPVHPPTSLKSNSLSTVDESLNTSPPHFYAPLASPAIISISDVPPALNIDSVAATVSDHVSEGPTSFPSLNSVLVISNSALASSTPPSLSPSPTPDNVHGGTTATSASAAHKKFTAVNVNRKFLEKSSTTAAIPAAPTLTPKSGTPNGPTHVTGPQSTAHHSRLVTTKLTSSGQLITSQAPTVWTRPSSSATSPGSGATSPPANQHLSNVNGASITSQSMAPGKGSVPPFLSRGPTGGEKSSKSSSATAKAWNSAKQSVGATIPLGAAVEFPTAAEAASGRRRIAQSTTGPLVEAPPSSTHPTNDSSAAKSQQEATDAFRGLLLDPKAHHWDEDGDDDDFLNQTIEFGDGTQYQIKHEVLDDQTPLPETDSGVVNDRDESAPVRKEDRFGHDIGRGWWAATPRAPHDNEASTWGRLSPERDRPPTLFNDRLNRFEQAAVWATKPPDNSWHGHQGLWSEHPESHDRDSGYSRRLGHGHGPPPFARGEESHHAPMPRRSSLSSNHGHPDPLNQMVGESVHVIESPSSPHDRTGPRTRGPSFAEHADGSIGYRRDARQRPPGDGGPHPPLSESVRFGERSHDAPARDPALHGHDRSMLPPSMMPQKERAQSHTSGHDQGKHKLGTASFPLNANPLDRASNASPVTTTRSLSPSLSMASPRSVSALPTPINLQPPHSVSHPIPPSPLTLKVPTANDIVGFSKESMHTAAERARERKRAEEEQRERDKERARQKAAKLAADAVAAEEAQKAAEVAEAAEVARKAAEADLAAEALIREELAALEKAAVSTARTTEISADPGDGLPVPSLEHIIWRVRSSRGTKRGAESKRPLLPSGAPQRPTAAQYLLSSEGSSGTPSGIVPSSANGSSQASLQQPPFKGAVAGLDHKSDWRSKRTPMLASPQVFDAMVVDDGHLEIFDFSDMAKMVGDVGKDEAASDAPLMHLTPSSSSPPSPIDSRGSRVASAWRNNAALQSHPADHGLSVLRERHRPSQITPPSPQEQLPSALTSATSISTVKRLPSPTGSIRTLLSPKTVTNLPLPSSKHLRESSIDSVMSRIKGALSDMRPGESTSALEHALAAAGASRKSETQANHEEFATSKLARPFSPVPAQSRVRVKVPHLRPHSAPKQISTRVLHLWKLPPRPVRWDILSWDPPVAGMSRKTLSLDEVLMDLDDDRVIVSLPRTSTISSSKPTAPGSAPSPRVHLPASTPSQKTYAMTTSEPLSLLDPLNPRTRSSPPVSPVRRASLSLPPSQNQATLPSTDNAVPPAPSLNPSRPKSSSRLPSGKDVAFYREVEDAKSLNRSFVSFTVHSELEHGVGRGDGTRQTADDIDAVAPKTSDDHPRDEQTIASAPISRNITPPPTSTPWTKSPLVYPLMDSSSRTAAADPENIKSLWETNDRNVMTTENSLKGIADEPPTFLISDFKSDYGEDGKAPITPSDAAPSPPTSSSASSRRATIRLSAADVSRAFQQVPQGPPSSATESSPPTPSLVGSEANRVGSVGANQPVPRYQVYPQTPNPGYVYAPTSYGITAPGQRPLATQLAGQHASQLWMPLTPGAGVPYYRPGTSPYGQPVVYSPSTMPLSSLPSPYSPIPSAAPIVNPIAVNTAAPTLPARHPSGGSFQLPSPASIHSPVPGYAHARMTPGYFTPGVQPSPSLPYHPSPAVYGVMGGPSQSGTPPSTLYSSSPHGSHGPHRPPPTW